MIGAYKLTGSEPTTLSQLGPGLM